MLTPPVQLPRRIGILGGMGPAAGAGCRPARAGQAYPQAIGTSR